MNNLEKNVKAVLDCAPDYVRKAAKKSAQSGEPVEGTALNWLDYYGYTKCNGTLKPDRAAAINRLY